MKKSKLKILKGLPAKIAGDKMLKPVSTFLVLKTLYKSGTIFNFSERKKEIAPFCDISPRTLHTRVKELIALKLVRFDGKTLCLSSYSTLYELIGIAGSKHHYIKHEHKAEHLIKLLALKENIRSQEKEIYRKLKDRCESEGITHEEAQSAELSRFVKAFKDGDHHYFNFVFPEATLSQSTIARLYNLTYYGPDGESRNSSGQYWQDKFKKMGLIKTEYRQIEGGKTRHTRLGFVFWSRQQQFYVCQRSNKMVFL